MGSHADGLVAVIDRTLGLARFSRVQTRVLLAFILVGTFVSRLIQLDQPIVENYVGRQIPTAMVARNLERGSGFGHPQLDVAPFPNLFLVEPPVYQAIVVGLRTVSGLSLERSGRTVSAFGITLAAWGLFGLTARRRGDGYALATVVCFSLFPITIRYGRAFQPDALMLGAILAGLRLWDEVAEFSDRWKPWVAWLLTSLGFALKITSAFVLVPLLVVILARRRWTVKVAAIGCLIPAMAWYIHAALLMNGMPVGSAASAENGRIWAQVMIPWALLQRNTYVPIVRFLVVRAFVPIALPLALMGLAGWKPEERLWRFWGFSAVAVLAALAAKLHHEYYFLILAPLVAVGMVNAFAWIASQGAEARLAVAPLVLGFMIGCHLCSASTWVTPREWTGIVEAGRVVAERVDKNSQFVAPEALIYYSDRKGCRLEYTRSSASRAASEWGVVAKVGEPIELVEFYRSRGAEYFADLAFDDASPDRLALHNAVRRRYNVVIDRPGLLLARLTNLEP